MKRITLATLIFIAFVISVYPSASPPAHAQILCEYRLLTSWSCVDAMVPDCECEDEFLSQNSENPNCPNISPDLRALRECCRNCEGVIIRIGAGTL